LAKDDLQAGVTVSDIGVVSCYGNAKGSVRRINATDDKRCSRIRDINDLQAGVTISDIGVVARDGNAPGSARRIDTAFNMRKLAVIQAVLSDAGSDRE
jgi:hypothetical protein